MATHEVWLELSSGSRVLVGDDLDTVEEANVVARHWRELAQDRPEELHETAQGSGCAVRGSAIVAIKAQLQVRRGAVLKVPRDGSWL